MAARNATKAAKATPQEGTEQAEVKPVDEQQAPTTPPADDQAANQTPPQDETRDGAPSEMTADYVHAEGFTLNADGDVVDAEGLALPPVFEGEAGVALVLLGLAKACMPAFEQPSPAAASADPASCATECAYPAAVADVLAERARQVVVKGYTPERDAGYQSGELAMAAACYAVFAAGQQPNRSVFNWPFATAAFRPHDKRRAMVKAAALLLAAIEAEDLAEAVE